MQVDRRKHTPFLLPLSLRRLSLPAPGLVMEPMMLLNWGVGAAKTVAESAQRVKATKLVERIMAIVEYGLQWARW
jgi:hypothetical protein